MDIPIWSLLCLLIPLIFLSDIVFTVIFGVSYSEAKQKYRENPCEKTKRTMNTYKILLGIFVGILLFIIASVIVFFVTLMNAISYM